VRILLLQLKRIGDLILTTPAIRCLRESFPDARLALVADSSCADLLGAIAVDERWTYRKGAGLRGLLGFGPNAWLRRDLLPFNSDWILDFTGTDRSAFLSTFSSSTRKVTFQRFQKKPLRRYLYTDFVDSSVSQRHTADHYSDLLAPLGLRPENIPLDLRLTTEDLDEAQRLLAKENAPETYAVIHAGAARPEKYWLPQRWAEVINFLHNEFGLLSVLTGSAQPKEQQHLSELRSLLHCHYIDLSGKTDLRGLAAIIKNARLLCGVDTAAVHLADAMNTASLALFGPTNPYHWRPRHARSAILRAGTEPPFTPQQAGGPMEAISSEAVIEILREFLE
jgi:ADP-heptose:LPS heptosyltransferase